MCGWTGKRNDHSDFPPKYDLGLRARGRRSPLDRFQPKMKVVKYVQSTCKILLSVSNSLRVFCLYFFTRLFCAACISCVICVQLGGFTRKKHACNAAMPVVACTVLHIHNGNIFICSCPEKSGKNDKFLKVREKSRKIFDDYFNC